MFTSKLFRVAYAISQAEGWRASTQNAPYSYGTASWSNHNPGNLRSSPFQAGVTQDGFAVFENDLVGFYALVWQLWVYAGGGFPPVPKHDTIGQAISTYNGLDINSPAFNNYMDIIEKVGGVSRNDPIGSIL